MACARSCARSTCRPSCRRVLAALAAEGNNSGRRPACGGQSASAVVAPSVVEQLAVPPLGVAQRSSSPRMPQTTVSVPSSPGASSCAARRARRSRMGRRRRRGRPGRARSISCPDALKTYVAPPARRRSGTAALRESRSTTLIGSPLCSDTALHTSTASVDRAERALGRRRARGTRRPACRAPSACSRPAQHVAHGARARLRRAASGRGRFGASSAPRRAGGASSPPRGDGNVRRERRRAQRAGAARP